MDISSLTDNEYVAIVWTYNTIGNVDEEQALRDRGYTEQEIRYALGKAQFSSFKSLNVIFHKKNNLNYPLLGYVLALFSQYDKGVLPFPGAMSEQPSKIIEIFDVLEQLKFEHQEKTRKKLEKERK